MRFNRIFGEKGKVDVPGTGLVIGETSSWDLSRREDTPPDRGEWVLRASFSSLVGWMFSDPGLTHRFVVQIGAKQYRLIADDDARTVLDGRSLLIEGVRLASNESNQE